MLGSLAFFSLAHVGNPAGHRRYNEWHQLDHRPENLLLPAVAWGERWVRSPDCVQGDPQPLGDFHYLNMYWLREPVDESRREWSALAERSFHWGRRADLELCTRPMMGFFVPVRGESARRVRVSADALPMRPNRGVHVEILRLADARSTATMRWLDWYDRERVPELLDSDGVAGVWAFADEGSFTTPRDLVTGSVDGSMRLHLTYLDGDPVEVAAPLGSVGAAGAPVEGTPEVLFAGVLRSITPWEWDWFDEEIVAAEGMA